MFEMFEHTADLGLRVRAADLDSLFAEAGMALFSALVDNLDSVQPLVRVEVKVTESDREFQLFDWLRELLYLFDSRKLLLCRFECQVGTGGLEGAAWGEPLDRSRHLMGHEVKAITYHGLKVEPAPEGWLAEVIVDI